MKLRVNLKLEIKNQLKGYMSLRFEAGCRHRKTKRLGVLHMFLPSDIESGRDQSRLQREEKRGSWPESKLVLSSLIGDVKLDFSKEEEKERI